MLPESIGASLKCISACKDNDGYDQNRTYEGEVSRWSVQLQARVVQLYRNQIEGQA
jgi:hypothetical protein